MSLRRWLSMGCAVSIVAIMGVVPCHAAKVKGLTPGTVYLAPGHAELFMEVFNPTTKAIVVQFQVLHPVGNWDLTSYSQSVDPGDHRGISFYCDDTSYCGGIPLISPATVVPSLRWSPATGGSDFSPAGGFKTMR